MTEYRLVFDIAPILRYRRKTQSWLARQLGCSRQTVSRWASGKQVPKKEDAARICVILACEPGELYKLRMKKGEE